MAGTARNSARRGICWAGAWLMDFELSVGRILLEYCEIEVF